MTHICRTTGRITATNSSLCALTPQHVPNPAWARLPHWAGALSRATAAKGSAARVFIYWTSRGVFPPSSFLTTPFGPQIVDKNLWTILEYLEISSRALSIFLCVNSLSDTLFVTRSISGYPTLFLSRLSLNVKKHPPPQPCSSAHSERTIAWRRL